MPRTDRDVASLGGREAHFSEAESCPTLAYILQRSAASMDPRAFFLAAISCLALACSSSSEGSDATNDEEVRVARCEASYAAPLRAKVARARAKLDRPTSQFAIEVRDALDQGKVKVMPFCQMTRSDFEEYVKELKPEDDFSEFGATHDEQYRALRDGNEKLLRTVHADVYGYMWDDRVYLSSNMTDAMTLETLAHEVKHVMRKAHLRNFHDQRVTCVEEHEAARAERFVHVDTISPEEDRKLLDRVHELYELDKLAPGTCGYR